VSPVAGHHTLPCVAGHPVHRCTKRSTRVARTGFDGRCSACSKISRLRQAAQDSIHTWPSQQSPAARSAGIEPVERWSVKGRCSSCRNSQSSGVNQRHGGAGGRARSVQTAMSLATEFEHSAARERAQALALCPASNHRDALGVGGLGEMVQPRPLEHESAASDAS